MDIIQKKETLEFVYNPYNEYCDWLIDKLDDLDPMEVNNGVHVAGTFFFNKNDLIKVEETSATFLLGEKIDNYYKIKGRKLGINFDVYIVDTLKIEFKMLSISKYKNLFQYIEDIRMINEDLYIGGDTSEISIDDFKIIISKFPKPYEKELYLKSKIQFVLENYFENIKRYDEKLDRYLEKKGKNINIKNNREYILNDITKYKGILNNLQKMLKTAEYENYTESEWGKIISDILLFIFPKYIGYHQEVTIRMTSDNSKKSKEKIDFMLVKSDGTIDLLEIKKPNGIDVISKSLDHDNYYATNSLSRVTMQIEKYLYNISRDASNVEKNLMIKYSENYNQNFKFKVINPKGMILIGSSYEYDNKRLSDLEIIKRMYSNIIDIYTYDDLIEMLENIIYQLEKKI